MAFIIFCSKLLAYLLLIILLLLNWVKRKAIRKTSVGTIKYNNSGAINLQIKHKAASSVLYLPSPLSSCCGGGLLEVIYGAESCLNPCGRGRGWNQAQEPVTSSPVPVLFQAFLSLIVAKSKPLEWREIKKRGSPVVRQRGLQDSRNLQLPTPASGTSHTATTGTFTQLFPFRQPGTKLQSQGSSPSQ